jgi:SAM-dependent methyltransferase
MGLLLRAYHHVIPPKIDREIRRAVALQQDRFPHSLNLPRGFGKNMNERVVEILIARLTYTPGKNILDVGHANATNAHLRMLQSLPKPIDITGIDITAANDAVRLLYTNSVVANIIKTDFTDATFDLIWCISALEHFGMDNSVYTSEFTLDTDMDVRALKEMTRILREGGTVYVSVPFGKFENHGWYRNYDQDLWQRLLAVARPICHVDELYFKYSAADGWFPSNPSDLATTGYADYNNSGASGLAVALIKKMS